MLFENLESRRLMSVSLNPVSKVLNVYGTNNNDNIVISQTSTHIKVNDNGVLSSYLASNVNKISVLAYDGADHVTLEPSVTKPSFIDSGKNSDGGQQALLWDRLEVIKGGSGKDEIVLRSQEWGVAYGNNGDDVLTAYGYEVGLYGGAGNDRLVSSSGGSYARTMNGGTGTDTIDYSIGSYGDTWGIYVNNGTSAWTITNPSVPSYAFLADSLISIENFSGTQGNDIITGTSGANKIWGNGGKDNIKGGDGKDSIYGGAGDDALYGEGGDDYLQGDGGNDFLSGGAGKDAMHGNDGNDTFYSKDSVADFLSGGAGTDKATGINRDAIDVLNSIELT